MPFTPLGFVSCAPPARLRRTRAHASSCPVTMSGVNGGIDYSIDLRTLPEKLAARVRIIQEGPNSPTDLITSAQEIAHASPSVPETLPVLVDILGYNNPVAARIAVNALVEAGKPAVPVLLTGVGAFNYAVNAYALRALGGIGDPSVATVCATCAESGPIPGVRRAACLALSGLEFHDVDAAVSAHDVLVRMADGERDWGVQYAAVVGLEQFHSSRLLPDAVYSKGVDVLNAIAHGRQGADDDSSASSRDAVVKARAEIALGTLLGRRESNL